MPNLISLSFLQRLFTITALLCLLGDNIIAAPRRSDDARPNILIIVADDQGYGDSSCYFHPEEVNTPNIDRLSKSGIRFTNATK